MGYAVISSVFRLTNFDESCNDYPKSDGVRNLNPLPLHVENFKFLLVAIMFLTQHH